MPVCLLDLNRSIQGFHGRDTVKVSKMYEIKVQLSRLSPYRACLMFDNVFLLCYCLTASNLIVRCSIF